MPPQISLADKYKKKYADGYVSPTIFMLADAGISSYKYYKTQSACLRQYLLIQKKMTGKEPAYETLKLSKEAKPRQMGVAVDFFEFADNVGLYPLSYKDVKAGIAKSPYFFCMARFYKPDSNIAYWTVFTAGYLGAAAGAVKGLTAAKVEALDAYQRELTIAQLNYNAYTVYMKSLVTKKMTKAAWDRYEAAANKRAKMQGLLNDFVSAKEIDINFKKQNKIGVLLVDDIIIIGIVCTMVLIGYLAPKIINAVERIKTVNASYDFQKFLKEQDLDIELKRKAGLLSDARADALKNSNAQDGKAAQDVVTQTVENAGKESEKSIFDSVQNIMLIGGGIFLISKIYK